ncbi:MAG: protein-export chaperone SecB [Chitinophagia bacterium]|nr:protein-export chaperone SecB [Chitinophagia bacterium]
MTEQATPEQHQFFIQRVYTKNVSFEAPNSPQIFQQEWEPELNLDLNVKYTNIEKDLFEVVLMVTAEVKNKSKVAFLVEVEQAGIFTIQGANEEQLDHALGSFCPSLLFPYARETISTEVTRGSFPQLVLSPVNFDAIYWHQKQEAQAQKS